MNSQTPKHECEAHSHSFLSVEQALNLLLDSVIVNASAQTLALDESLAQILAKNICATINVPSFDNTAVDGYAISIKPEQINKPGTLSFKITDRIAAGGVGKVLKSGCAARIFTGAPIPQGANSVIMQEECELSKDAQSIETHCPLSLGENIRLMGEDIAKGDIILQAGKRLKPQDLALAASVGTAKLSVFKKIKVGIFFTGNELVEPGSTLINSQIFNSNRYALVALLNELGCEVINLGNIKDDLQSTCQALETLKFDCHLIITTGGVSVGEEDYVKPAVKKLGKLSLWRIKMKPGRPLAFGNIGNTIFIGLPGNPVSAMVTFFLFVQPVIKKMQGVNDYKNQTLPVQCSFDWKKPRLRCEFVRVQLDYKTVPPSASLYPKQDSNILSSLVWADGLVEIPEDMTFTKGEVLNYYSLTQS